MTDDQELTGWLILFVAAVIVIVILAALARYDPGLLLRHDLTGLGILTPMP